MPLANTANRDGRLLADVISTAITGGLTASKLADLELCYAPQFGSAKDSVNFLGWAYQNIADGLVEAAQWHELDVAVAAGTRLVDVPDGDLIVHCAAGLRSYVAARILTQHGRRARSLDGGFATWADGMASLCPGA